MRPNAGHAVALKWTMKNIYGVGPGDVYWAASDVGWVVGHSYIVYAPLLNRLHHGRLRGQARRHPGCRRLLAGDPGARVKTFFTAPTAFRAIKRVDPEGRVRREIPMPSCEAMFFAGERCDPDTLHWAERMLGVPVIDHWWQTETGYAVAANPWGLELLPVKPGSPTVPMPGYDVQILDDDGQPVGPDTSARSPSACRCRRAACRRSGTPTTGSPRAISTPSPAGTRPAMRG